MIGIHGVDMPVSTCAEIRCAFAFSSAFFGCYRMNYFIVFTYISDWLTFFFRIGSKRDTKKAIYKVIIIILETNQFDGEKENNGGR